MGWPEISVEDFPPRRDDEPSSLRQDIIDELSDHFVCALNRELLKNPDEQVARKRVLERFGDPIEVARQLWLDAMKEKIMSQRIMTGLSAVMAVCCLAVVGIAWSMMKQSEQVNLKLLEQLTALANRPQPDTGTQVNQQILKQLEKLNERQTGQAGSISDLLSPITFELVQEGAGGTPARGFTGTLLKRGSQTDTFKVEAVSDETGILNFKRLPWGQYQLSLTAPWGETLKSRMISTIPGRPYQDTIVCPAHSPPEVSVSFAVERPKQSEQQSDYLLCDFRNRNFSGKQDTFSLVTPRDVNGSNWYFSHDLADHPTQGVYLIDLNTNQVMNCPLDEQGLFVDLNQEQLKANDSVKMAEGIYGDPACYLLQKEDLSKLSELNLLDNFGVVYFDFNNSNDMRILVARNAGSRMLIRPFGTLKMEPQIRKSIEQRHGIVKNSLKGVKFPDAIRFAASEAQANLWEITIPNLFPITRESGSLSSVP